MCGEESKHYLVLSGSGLSFLTVQCDHSGTLNINIIFFITVSVIILIIHQLTLLFLSSEPSLMERFYFCVKSDKYLFDFSNIKQLYWFQCCKLISAVLSDVINDINSSRKFYYLLSLACIFSKK